MKVDGNDKRGARGWARAALDHIPFMKVIRGVEQKMLTPFRGNCPQNTRWDTKYHIRFDNRSRQWKVVADYKSSGTREECPSTKPHIDLVSTVNFAKQELNGRPGGVFYINEFKQVLVTDELGNYYLAGIYKEVLEFLYRGKLMTGVNPSNLYRGYSGRRWRGVCQGIPYYLSDDYSDIHAYNGVYANTPLSTYRLPNLVRGICGDIRNVKRGSGKFYINEHLCLFAPKLNNPQGHYYFISQLPDLKYWFPNPQGFHLLW